MENKVVAAARRWIGTPYRHQASVCGVGCDCLGLVRGVCAEVMGGEAEVPPAYAPDWNVQGGDDLRAALARNLAERDAARPGDVLLFRMRATGAPRHLGVLAGTSFIHAYSRHGVVESAFSAPWQRRVSGAFSFSDRGL